jgi:hypothetical protein
MVLGLKKRSFGRALRELKKVSLRANNKYRGFSGRTFSFSPPKD